MYLRKKKKTYMVTIVTVWLTPNAGKTLDTVLGFIFPSSLPLCKINQEQFALQSFILVHV